MSAGDWTEAEWAEIERIDLALQALGDGSPSRIARKAKVDSRAAHEYLRWMVRHRLARSSGNGAWTHYQPWGVSAGWGERG